MKQSDSTNVARQVELIIRRLNSLSTLPSVAVNFLAQLTEPNTSLSRISQIIEADAALSAQVLSLARRQGFDVVKVSQAVEKLPPALLRDAILSVKVFQVFDADYDPDKIRPLPRKQLAVHALAVACAASLIAEQIRKEPYIDPQLAFSAGLLHDIGKLAIDEVMPKSFERVAIEAKSMGLNMADVERKYLGIDHCIVGKRLAEKWNLPKEIVLAIWLHNSDPDAISQNMPDARIAQIVRLADNIARSCQLGNSGSFGDSSYNIEMLNNLSLAADQVDKITRDLPQQVHLKTQLLALDSDRSPALWCQAIHNTAIEIAHDNTRLVSENTLLQIDSGLCQLLREFVSEINIRMSAIDMAAVFASKFQKLYNTGPICIYLPDSNQQDVADTVTIDENQRSEFLLVKSPPDNLFVTSQLQNSDSFSNAYEQFAWLFEQISVSFDPARTKATALIANGISVGAMIIEIPQQNISALPDIGMLTKTVAFILAQAGAHFNQEILSEQFAQIVGKLSQTQEQLASAQSLHAVAELAAGAAHELNNPLAVISGRAQLLQEVETDQNKKQMLRQIEERAGEIAKIIEELLAFAQPEPADIGPNSVRDIIEDALRQTAQKHNLNSLETTLTNLDNLPEINVDSSQISSAIANVLSNALESYPGSNGPISISGHDLNNGKTIELRIQDQGSGMDSETLRKAMLPFFSAKPAGRKRGMGLAQTQRLLQLNNASIRLSSQPDSGTTATITLPCFNP